MTAAKPPPGLSKQALRYRRNHCEDGHEAYTGTTKRSNPYLRVEAIPNIRYVIVGINYRKVQVWPMQLHGLSAIKLFQICDYRKQTR